MARRRLDESGTDLFSPEAWRDLERWLAARLSGFAAEALGADFDRFRGGRPDGFAVRLAEAGVGRDTRLYRAFIDSLLVDGLAAWARELPVLARLTATAVDLWVRHVLELLAHWREDAAAVHREVLDEPGGSSRVARVAAGLSDAHAGGRTVHVLTLEGGARVVYKPRSLGMDVAFARCLAWCNERGAPSGLLDFKLHRLLDRGDHGWAEFVAAEPCRDAEAARRFHRRAGQLLALLHASGGRDAHFENLVAHGEHPVLIDAEAWLPPRLARWLPLREGEDEGWAEATRRLESSVLPIGLLPHWQPDGPRDDVIDVGGLGGGRPGTRLRPVWRAVNTDRMVRAWGPVETGVRPNVPLLDGRPLSPPDQVGEVREGFTDLYQFLLAHRDEILSASGPWGDLAGLRGRLIFRPTLAYARLRDRSLRPAASRDAAARGAELEALARVYLDAPGDSPPATWPLLTAERRALELGDIPVFQADLTGTVLEGSDGERIPAVIARPAAAELRDRLCALGAEDLEEQLRFIDAALAPTPSLPREAGEGAPSHPRTEELSSERPPLPLRGGGARGGGFLSAALDLAEAIRSRAIQGRDGSVAWIGPRYLSSGETFELAPLGTDLYGGTAGIAIFFAALDRVAGGGGRDLALRTAASLGRASGGIGGLTGLGSRIYALVTLGELLEDAEPIRTAHRLAARITPERIAADDGLDVTFGAAGALLALLALEASLPSDSRDEVDPLETAAACARHLLARRLPSGAWAALGRPAEAGFAHGVAGIAHALLRFSARTGDRESRQAALAAIAFERILGTSQTTWCRGAPGLALARFGTLDVADDEEIRGDIQAALAATRASGLTPMDHLCCGNLGRAEVLLAAGETLGEAELVDAARELAGQVLDRAAARGGLAWLPSGQVSAFDPSFFKGAAGAGYTLLRLAAPGRLPCVLRLAPPAGGLHDNVDPAPHGN